MYYLCFRHGLKKSWCLFFCQFQHFLFCHLYRLSVKVSFPFVSLANWHLFCHFFFFSFLVSQFVLFCLFVVVCYLYVICQITLVTAYYWLYHVCRYFTALWNEMPAQPSNPHIIIILYQQPCPCMWFRLVDNFRF